MQQNILTLLKDENMLFFSCFFISVWKIVIIYYTQLWIPIIADSDTDYTDTAPLSVGTNNYLYQFGDGGSLWDLHGCLKSVS